jgi:hypothetical protein
MIKCYDRLSPRSLNFTVSSACLVDDPSGRHDLASRSTPLSWPSTARRDAYCRPTLMTRSHRSRTSAMRLAVRGCFVANQADRRDDQLGTKKK